mmetsp:Transcript_22472/g.52482  ORF Transcript_22472/g.52482 Transcript_22472/m.52482 type:complete len:242 (+) Transcript_22472:58-783(+)
MNPSTAAPLLAIIGSALGEDVTSLLQHSLRTRSSRGLDTSKDSNQFDCVAHPSLCEAPFNCQDLTIEEQNSWSVQGLAANGTNFRSWCALPQYEDYSSRCARGDIDGAARAQFLATTSGKFGPFTMEMDGSYCFIDGHCANTAVTNETTIKEAEALCDKRFGRAAWATFSFSSMGGRQLRLVPRDLSKGFQNPSQTRPFVLAACAMGNFHCDVRMCQVGYCREEYYVKKYGHFLKEYGWVK